MKMLAVAVALLTLAGSPREADACSCGGARAFVSPDTGPTNAHVFVWIPADRLDAHMSPLALRVEGSRARLDVEETSILAGDLRIVELAPRAALLPKTAYEVVDHANNVIDRFTAGDGPVTEKLTWKGATVAELARFKSAGGGSCRIHSTFVRVVMPDASQSALYAVWVAGKDGKIDYTKAPSTIAGLRGGTKSPGTMYLGRTSLCGRDNFTIPKGPRARLGIKMIGATGATSTESEVLLELGKPIELDGY